jgi:hypothetical protein
VDLRGLKYGAPRCSKPSESFCERELSDWAAIGTTFTNPLKGLDVFVQLLNVRGIGKEFQTLFVEVKYASEKFLLRAKQNDAHIDELLAFNMRNNANDGVFK